MDIGEQIAVEAIAMESKPCWYCEEPGNSNIKNDEEADPQSSDSEDEDEVPENDAKNDSSKLGGNLKNKPGWTIDCPDNGQPTEVLSAAHHCIPGNASLKKAISLHKFMREDGPLKLANDIGYDVNHENNGVWLPGNYGVRAGKGHYTKKWGGYNELFKEQYANLAMKAAGAQFHDAHSEYSEKVLDTLRKVAAKLGNPKDKCPICDKKLDKTRPPYGLVGRLDGISAKHRAMITNLSKTDGRKFVAAGYFTSSRVKKFFGLW